MNQLQKLKHEIAKKNIFRTSLRWLLTFLLISCYEIFVGEIVNYEFRYIIFSFGYYNTLVLLTFMSVFILKYLKLNVNISWV